MFTDHRGSQRIATHPNTFGFEDVCRRTEQHPKKLRQKASASDLGPMRIPELFGGTRQGQMKKQSIFGVNICDLSYLVLT